MDYQQAREYVVSQLSKQASRDDIIYGLCQATGSSWQQASAFVDQVQEQDHGRIAFSQAPVLLIIGVVTFLLGLYLAGREIMYFASVLRSGEPGYLILPLSVREFFILFTGLAMMAGSVWGSWKVVRKLLE
ncbi:MAG: hypothetical protein ACM3JD_18855 [Rudaea sp.]